MFELKNQTDDLRQVLHKACHFADSRRDQFLTPEHFLWALGSREEFIAAAGTREVPALMEKYIANNSETVPPGKEYEGAEPSLMFMQVLASAYGKLQSSGATLIDLSHILSAIMVLPNNYAANTLNLISDNTDGEFFSDFLDQFTDAEDVDNQGFSIDDFEDDPESYEGYAEDEFDDEDDLYTQDEEYQGYQNEDSDDFSSDGNHNGSLYNSNGNPTENHRGNHRRRRNNSSRVSESSGSYNGSTPDDYRGQGQGQDSGEAMNQQGNRQNNGNGNVKGHSQGSKNQPKWMEYLTCLNDLVDERNPLIGREEELERTIQILCRKDKNNPLYCGEAGVGKTALAYGLARKIVDGDIPTKLANAKIYELDMGSLISGAQFRGDFEKRLKSVMNGLLTVPNPILFIDEIHMAIGAGRTEGGAMDASNLLKPYLEQGHIRFMGATTYDEFNRNFSRSKGFARRFEKIDIPEPSIEDTKKIIRGLKDRYERFHNVRYTDEALDFAVEAAEKYITGKFLPDKAIDLIDEAAAWRQLHPMTDSSTSESKSANAQTAVNPVNSVNADNTNSPGVAYYNTDTASDRTSEQDKVQIVDKGLIAQVLAKICNAEILASDEDDNKLLEQIESKLKDQIYGQDKAIQEVTEAVQIGSAGLLDDNKPIASLLFVGPTGVGKTEVAKVLAKELALPLIRFDMSEYAEKHTVAKLIGSPAGYVGYEDGGLLTDAVRKNPHCVLLLDELEKAHSDIYNILLQVMDYASLTDNKGQKTDFRHAIIIMTTNAGAQYARQAGVGFTKTASAGETMMKNVKSTFKPEFLNRLSAITVFNDMDRRMSELILDKKLRQLQQKLTAKNVKMQLTEKARELLVEKGFSEDYGGREVDRIINNLLKPILMRELLFGELKRGGTAVVDITSPGDSLMVSQVIPAKESVRSNEDKEND